MIKHLAIIMDGNRRWAKENKKRKYEGYSHGAHVAKQILESCLQNKIPYLTLYAFSYENWNRPLHEIAAIMNIGLEFLQNNRDFMIKNGIKCRVIGNKELLPSAVNNIIAEIEAETHAHTVMNLQIALSYGSRDEIVRACVKYSKQIANDAPLNEKTFSKFLDTYNIPDPDLLIRTGGEKRLSNYMLWQLAYTELFFVDTLWPNFSAQELDEIIKQYASIQRRFGRI